MTFIQDGLKLGSRLLFFGLRSLQINSIAVNIIRKTAVSVMTTIQ